MAALNFIITDAGRGLLSNVSTIGPVTITKVAIGSAGYTPSASATALTTQIKQITPEGSSVPTPGMIHITASDKTTDAYTVKEIGLYAGTTLFAIYSQTAAILTKSSGNVALFSIDLALTNVPAGSVTIGNASFEYPPATETVKGVALIATAAKVAAGTDDETIVTPAKLSAAGFVKKSGDTMTGALVLSGDPSSSLQAATKQYTDGKVAKAGDTMTGALVLPGNPTEALQAACKQYVDGALSSGANGYHKLPSGLIMQWGTQPDDLVTRSFPIAFPNAVVSMVATSNNTDASPNVQLLTKTQYKVQDGSLVNSNHVLWWIAIGY